MPEEVGFGLRVTPQCKRNSDNMSRSQQAMLYRGIYVVHEREFVRSGEPVFKPGRTGDLWGRLKGYPKGTMLVTFRHCAVSESKLVELETGLLAELMRNPRLRQRTDFGREYFEGDVEEVVSVVFEYLAAHKVPFVAAGSLGGAADDVEDGSGAPEASGTPDASDAPKEADAQPALVLMEPAAAVKEFVEARQAGLASRRVLSREVFAEFQEFARTQGMQVPVEHSQFTKCLCVLTGARSVTSRSGLIVERYIEFPSMGVPLEALVTEFVGERCVLRPGALLPAPKLCEALGGWISERHPAEPPMAHAALMRTMKALGFERSKSALRCRGYPSAVHCFSGISMKEPDLPMCKQMERLERDSTLEAFMCARLEQTGNVRDHVSLKTLYADYCMFCAAERRAADRKSGFKDTMVATIGSIVEASNKETNFWKGWRLRDVVAAPRPGFLAAAPRGPECFGPGQVRG